VVGSWIRICAKVYHLKTGDLKSVDAIASMAIF